MNRETVIARLKALEQKLRAMGVAALYLYGSYARDEARPDSDIDVVFELGPEGFPDRPWSFMAPQVALEEAFPGVDIGCSTRDELHPLYRPHIEPSLVRVF
jgi:hypothetical protein